MNRFADSGNFAKGDEVLHQMKFPARQAIPQPMTAVLLLTKEVFFCCHALSRPGFLVPQLVLILLTFSALSSRQLT